MDAIYTVTFKGFPEKLAQVLEQWLREDIAAYPKRMAMDSASVVKSKSVVVNGKMRGKSRAKSR